MPIEPISKPPVAEQPAISDARPRRCGGGHACLVCPDRSGVAFTPKEFAAQIVGVEAQLALPTRFTRSFEIGSINRTCLLFMVFLLVVSFLHADPLLVNGSFEKVDPEDPERPLCWEKPDGLGVSWIEEKGRGKVICMDTSVSEKALCAQWEKKGITDWHNPSPSDEPVAAYYGLSFYSDFFEIEPGRPYRVSFDFRSSKPSGGGKLWIRGYGIFREKLRRRYETYIPCRTEDTKWLRISQCFHPTANTKDVVKMKVMLYAYWPPGKYYFDNIEVVPVSDEQYLKDKNEHKTSK
ncbi:MAG: hypothetical protein JW808_05230 [Victivallales bacterium]|nr:hypothetical protein [Victivallales bacterium]